jgi:exodeoxyribonuclease-3
MFNQEPGHYTWWTYRFGARARNAGWRIDYFFVSEELKDRVVAAWIEPGVHGSDHCPIGLELDAG